MALVISSLGYVTIQLYGALRASRIIHDMLINAILGTTLRWLDVVPVSRVIARATQDMRSVDISVSNEFVEVVEASFAIISRLVAIVLISPIFVIPSLLVAYIGWYCGQLYIRSQLSVKREMSNARAPVLAHFAASMAGLGGLCLVPAPVCILIFSFKRPSGSMVPRKHSSSRLAVELICTVEQRVHSTTSIVGSLVGTFFMAQGHGAH